MPNLDRTGVPGYARPLPIPPRGRGGGEVMASLVRRVAKEEGRVVAVPGLGVGSVLLGLTGPRSFGPSLTDVSWAAWPAT